MTGAHWGGGTTYAVRPTAYDANNTGTAAPPLSVLVRDLPAVLTVAAVSAQAVGQPSTVSATFTDPGTGETHAGLIDWGDGTTSAAAITEANGTGTVAAAHAYAARGSYTAMLIVTDSGGAVATASAAVTVTDPAVAGPTGLTAVAADDNDVTLTWTPNPADPNTTFEVQRQAADGAWATIGTVDDTTDGDTYFDGGLAALTDYAYRVRSTGATAADASAYTDPVSVTTPLTAPAAPTDLSATESTPGEVDLSWADASYPVTSYIITATPSGGPTQTITDANLTEMPFAVPGLTPGVTYSFAVAADDDQGGGHDARSAPSAAIQATAPAAALSVTAPATVAEGSPFQVTVTATSQTASTAEFTWRAAYDDGTPADALTGPTATVTHTPSAGVATVGVTVTATDGAGHAYALPAASVLVVPSAPTGLNAVAQTDADVLVTWQNATQIGGGSVDVLRSDDGGQSYAVVGTADAGAASFDDAGLTPATLYSYLVQAVAADGQTTAGPGKTPAGGGRATPATATTPSNALGLTVTPDPADPTQATVTWTYHGGDDAGYELEQEDASVAGKNFQLVETPGHVGTAGTDSSLFNTLPPGDDVKFRVRVDHTDGTVSAYVVVDLPPRVTPPTLSASPVAADPNDYAAGDVELKAKAADEPASHLQMAYQYEEEPAGGNEWFIADRGNAGTYAPDYTMGPDVMVSAVFAGPVPVVPGLGYHYRARIAYAGRSLAGPWSDAQTATMPLPLNAPTLTVVNPAPSVSTAADGSRTISWTDCGGDNVNYGVGWYQTDSETITPATVPYYNVPRDGSGHAVTHLTLPAGYFTPGAYQVVVKVDGGTPATYDGSGNQTAAATGIAGFGRNTFGTAPPTVPAAPSALIAIVDPTDGDQNLLHWHNVPGDETGYTVFRQLGLGGFVEIGTTAADVTAYTDPIKGTQSPGVARTYMVESNGTGGASNRVGAPAIYQPYAPSYRMGFASLPGLPGLGPRAILQCSQGYFYYWYRLLEVMDHDGGVIIQHITESRSYINPAGPFYPVTASYWEAIPVNAETMEADDWWAMSVRLLNIDRSVVTGDAIYYPRGSTTPSVSGRATSEAGTYSSTLTKPKNWPQVKPFHQELVYGFLTGAVPS